VRKIVSTLCFTILLIFGQIVFGQEKGVGVRNVSKLPSKEKRWALIIGVDTYQKDISPLYGTVNDAKALRDVLIKYAGFADERIILMTTDSSDADLIPTRGNIIDQLDKLQRVVPEDGLILFSFSGHGVSIGDDAFIVPADGRVYQNADLMRERAIDVLRIKRAIQATKAKQVIMFLDACRNDPVKAKGDADNDLTPAYAKGFSFETKNQNIEAYATLYATSMGDRAYEFLDRKTGKYRGYFSYAIEEGLRGSAANDKGEITLAGLIRYIGDTVKERVRINLNQRQVPYLDLGGSFSNGDLVIAVAERNAPVTTNPNLREAPKPTPLPTPTPVPVAQTFDAEGLYWTEISRRDTSSGYESYLAEYPTGKYAAEAKNRIDKFKQDELARLKNIERAKWRDAQDLDTKEGYNAYLTAYPTGEFATAARSGIKALETKDERAKWRETQGADTKAAYSAYLSAYPNGEFVTDARSAIITLENKEEQAKWDEVQILNRKSAFQSYLSVYPGGKYVAAARQKIADFEAEEARKLREQQRATELAKWEEAERLKTIEAYDGYLTSYPNGDYASIARLRLGSMGVTRSPVEETDWQEISGRGTRADYERYLSKYPEGKYASSAKQKIEETNWQEIGSLGTRADYERYLSKYPEGKYASTAKERIKEFEDEKARTLLAPIENDFAKSRYANVIQAAFPLLESISDKRGRINFLLGMSYYNLGDYEKSEPFLSNAIALGETVILKVKIYLPGAGSVGNVQNALPPGELILQKDFLEFKTWAYWDFRVPVNKIYELKYADPTYQFSIPNPQIVLKIGIPKSNGKEEKRSYNFQPSRTTMTSCQGYRWCASCPDCQGEAKAIYRLISGLKP
jgi:outer membrane protein assembly factor BamD (BamD/ComL family)